MKKHSMQKTGLLWLSLLLMLALCLGSCGLLPGNGEETEEVLGSETEEAEESTTGHNKRPVVTKDQSTLEPEPTDTSEPADSSEPTDSSEPSDTSDQNTPTDTVETAPPQPGVGERLPWEDGTVQ